MATLQERNSMPNLLARPTGATIDSQLNFYHGWHDLAAKFYKQSKLLQGQRICT